MGLGGPSGFAKSTLPEALAGFDDDLRAALHWNGFQLSDLNSEQPLHSLRHIPQEPMIFNGTFAENIIQKNLLLIACSNSWDWSTCRITIVRKFVLRI